MGKLKRYPVELRERWVRLVLEQQGTHQSQRATIWSSPDFVDTQY